MDCDVEMSCSVGSLVDLVCCWDGWRVYPLFISPFVSSIVTSLKTQISSSAVHIVDR